jgi:transposase-like protein
MNPQTPFCHHLQCPARGQVGQGTMRVHSPIEPRYRGTRCGQTFAATKGPPFYGLRTAADWVTTVLTLLCHGCPLQAIVAAFGLEERTGATWRRRAGQHGQQVHQSVVHRGQVDLPHVQADELWVTRVGRRVWMAMALAVPSRLWLGGVISPPRDVVLITRLRQRVRACACTLAILVGVDGLASDITACRRVFRHPVHTGRPGRPRLVPAQGWLLGQMVKRYVQRRVISVERRGVRGTSEAIAAVLATTGGGTGINTADIERLNATFRASLAPLVRRGRALAHTEALLTAGMWLVGCTYNCCWLHESLRLAAPRGAPWKWQEHTPAMAAGLTNHRWTMLELLRYPVPLPAWMAPKRRGRPPKRHSQPAMAVAA